MTTTKSRKFEFSNVTLVERNFLDIQFVFAELILINHGSDYDETFNVFF